MKKWLRLIIWIGLIVYFVAAFGFVAKKQASAVCESIKVTIRDSAINQFIQKEEILEIVLEKQKNLLGQKFSNINKQEIEELVNNHSYVKNSEIFSTVNGGLNINITQRKPMLRVVNGKRESYYIDSEGVIFPVSRNYTSRVLIANGYIFEPFNWIKHRELFSGNFELNSRTKVLYDLFTLTEYIYNNELWKAQFTQIYVNSKYEFELIPRVGAHIIYFGDISDYQEKFRKLEAMYLHGFINTGWNQYHAINLKFKNQVVCTKR